MRESGKHGRRLEELLARLVDEVITPEEFEKLESLLDGDEEAQRRYLHYLGLHAEMEESGVDSVRQHLGAQGKAIHWSRLAIPAAAVLVVFSIIVALWPDQRGAPQSQVEGSPRRIIGRITELNGHVLWTGDGGMLIQDLDVGDELGGGTLETIAQNSWIKIEFLDGSRIRVSGPTALTLSEAKDGKKVRLRKGFLSADIKPQIEGSRFRLDTTSAELEVLGTQFNVTADDSNTRVAVNEGSVRVRRLTDGQTKEVPADHHLSVDLNHKSNLEIVPRRQVIHSWSSELPTDLRYGHWDEGTEPGVLKAKPLLWKNDAKESLLLHVASLHPTDSHVSPIRLSGTSEIRVRGRLERKHPVVFGLTTMYPGGGFAGKFSTRQEILPDLDQSGFFEATLPLSFFRPEKQCFPASPEGHDVFDVWILTVREDVGLEVSQVEILAAPSSDR